MKKMKRITAALLAVVLVVFATPVSARSQPTFRVDSYLAEKPGDTVTVAIEIRDNPGLIALSIDVGYDEEILELVDAQGKDLGELSYGPMTACPFRLTWEDVLNADDSTVGVLAELTFRVREGAAHGARSPITVTYDPENVLNSRFENVTFAAKTGYVCVGVSYMVGDANDDGTIDSADLIRLANYLAGAAVEIGPGADANEDEEITADDLALITTYLAKYDYKTNTPGITLGKAGA